jgi:predicted RNase H-like HicB family nuclease
MKTYQFPIVVEKDEAGLFVADCPSLQGCHAQGKTLEEAPANIREAIELHIEDRIKAGEEIPQASPIKLTSLEVTV